MSHLHCPWARFMISCNTGSCQFTAIRSGRVEPVHSRREKYYDIQKFIWSKCLPASDYLWTNWISVILKSFAYRRLIALENKISWAQLLFYFFFFAISSIYKGKGLQFCVLGKSPWRGHFGQHWKEAEEGAMRRMHFRHGNSWCVQRIKSPKWLEGSVGGSGSS